jgi:hypothetical protein
MSAEQPILPLNVADHAHNVALAAMEKEMERQKTEIYKYQNTPGHNPQRLQQSWAQWHIINNYYNATINLCNSYNNEINKASYLVATANETNKVLKLRLEAQNIRPQYGASVKRDLFNHGPEVARRNHIARLEHDETNYNLKNRTQTNYYGR